MCKELELFSNVDDVFENATANFYSLLYKLNTDKYNFSIALPGDTPIDFFEEVCACLRDFSDYEAFSYDPLESREIGYECLYEDTLYDKIQIFAKMNYEADELNAINAYSLRKANMLICELTYNTKKYYLFMQQVPSDRVFKGKKEFVIGDGKIVNMHNSKGFVLSFVIGFIWEFSDEKKNSMMYVFDRTYFSKIFDYEEHLKKIVEEKSSVIEELPFLNNSSVLMEKLAQKNVYRSFAKIINDEDYIRAMNETPAQTLKQRLLEKSNSNFKPEDFDENDELIVTNESYKKIVKMICKGFKYNFFQDRAE